MQSDKQTGNGQRQKQRQRDVKRICDKKPSRKSREDRLIEERPEIIGNRETVSGEDKEHE